MHRIVVSGAGRVIGTLAVDLDERGLIVQVHNAANPDELGSVTARTVHPLS